MPVNLSTFLLIHIFYIHSFHLFGGGVWFLVTVIIGDNWQFDKEPARCHHKILPHPRARQSGNALIVSKECLGVTVTSILYVWTAEVSHALFLLVARFAFHGQMKK